MFEVTRVMFKIKFAGEYSGVFTGVFGSIHGTVSSLYFLGEEGAVEWGT